MLMKLVGVGLQLHFTSSPHMRKTQVCKFGGDEITFVHASPIVIESSIKHCSVFCKWCLAHSVELAIRIHCSWITSIIN